MMYLFLLLLGLGLGSVIGWGFSQAGRRLDDNLERLHAEQARQNGEHR